VTETEETRRFPVVETFGPTIQGEGPDAGRPCVFVRFGGCDYRCSWCDSLHAVLPAEVRKAERLTASEIVARIVLLAASPITVVLSGGNPALLELGGLVDKLHARGYRVTIETQGTKFKPWIAGLDAIIVSPKPPSSGMETDWDMLDAFLQPLWVAKTSLKVVVGNDNDYQYARSVRTAYPDHPFFVSVLNPAGSDADAFDIDIILSGYRKLCERIAYDPIMHDAKVLPQLHTLAWGAAQGV
jgi:7-carboxy-7-deazaguanine synthase